MRPDSKIFVAGSDELIGAALKRHLSSNGYQNLCADHDNRARLLDLASQADVDLFFNRHRPQFVFVTGGKSGGIAANQKFPATLMHHNLMVAANVIDAAWRYGATKLLYLGSSCTYPRLCPQPMRPEHLHGGPLEPTNRSYAAAKLAGIELCQAYRREHGADFIAGIPANAFGVEDDFGPEHSHVIGALIGRMHEAKVQGLAHVTVWGTGEGRREFIFADDLADACLFTMLHYSGDQPLNLGGGRAITIADLARAIREVVGFEGELVFDRTRPDGMPVKALDSAPLLALGWKPRTALLDALAQTYDAFKHSRTNVAVT